MYLSFSHIITHIITISQHRTHLDAVNISNCLHYPTFTERFLLSTPLDFIKGGHKSAVSLEEKCWLRLYVPTLFTPLMGAMGSFGKEIYVGQFLDSAAWSLYDRIIIYAPLTRQPLPCHSKRNMCV